ncbi:MAG: DMT family transporter [Cycloclasticus sp.]|nr:DMT family transporter [Cycloclasticus sp.]
MKVINRTAIYAMIMLVAGLGIPIMGALSGGLGVKLASSGLASLTLCAVGVVISFSILFLLEGLPKKLPAEPVPIHFYLGGFCIVLYTLSITWVGPRFGIGNAVCFVLLGQLISMSTIDHFGLMGAPRSPISWQRVIGLLLMLAGVFLVVKGF